MKTSFRILSLITLLFIILSSCRNASQHDEKTVHLRFDWIPTMAFAGDIVATKLFSDSNDLKIIPRPAGEGIDPIRMVITGVDDIGIVSLDQLLMANERGADLIAIGIIDYISPVVFLSKKKHNIQTPDDFLDKSIGVQSGGATEFVYKALLKKVGINQDQLKETRIGFDMRPFVEDRYDVRPGFITDEAVYLEINNIPFNTIEPINFGLRYPGRVYFTTRDFFENNMSLLNNFISAVAQGWEYALNNPTKAIDLLQEFEPQIDYNKELIGLNRGKKYFSGYDSRVLLPDIDAIEEMIIFLNEFRILTKTPNIQDFFYLEFIDDYHENRNN